MVTGKLWDAYRQCSQLSGLIRAGHSALRWKMHDSLQGAATGSALLRLLFVVQPPASRNQRGTGRQSRRNSKWNRNLLLLTGGIHEADAHF